MISRFFISTVLAAISAIAFGQLPSPTPACEIKHVCYILDQSGSISDNEYRLEQDFVKRIADEIDSTSGKKPSNSAVAFSRKVRTIQTPTENLQVFKIAVSDGTRFRSTTRISLGLKRCKSFLQGKTGSRTMVLLTDGMPDSSDRMATLNTAAGIRNAGINIVAVGIGKGAKADFLRQLVSEPEFYIDTKFDDLDSKIATVARAICGTIPIKDACTKAYDECLFKFSGTDDRTAFSIAGEPDKSFTPRIVPKDTTYSLGQLNGNIVPEFIYKHEEKKYEAKPITSCGSQRFASFQFKPFWMSEERGTGIGHETFHGNQLQVANNKCVRVYFSSFQEIPPNGQIVNRNNVPTTENKCVVFRTKL